MVMRQNLEKEATEYALEWGDKTDGTYACCRDGYLAGAEPREKRIAELKCECRRCVYSDCPCILSDYGKDRNGICDHFKDVFDENAELKKTVEHYRKEREFFIGEVEKCNM